MSFWCLQISQKTNEIFSRILALASKKRSNQKNKDTLFHYLIDAVGSSEILKAKQKLGVTFNFDKQDVIDLTKISKMTMCRASEANSEK